MGGKGRERTNTHLLLCYSTFFAAKRNRTLLSCFSWTPDNFFKKEIKAQEARVRGQLVEKSCSSPGFQQLCALISALTLQPDPHLCLCEAKLAAFSCVPLPLPPCSDMTINNKLST